MKSLLIYSITLLITIAVLFAAVVVGFVFRKDDMRIVEESKGQIVVNAVIVGAGTSGISAALELARSDYKVLLIEETDWLGGQMTAAAVSVIDEGYIIDKDPGIFGEFMTRVKASYGDKPINTCYWHPRSRCFEPHRGRRVLEEMIAEEPNIRVMYRTTVSDVRKDGPRVAGVVTTSILPENNNLLIPTSILIDATETGYLLPLAKARYRAGNTMVDTTGSRTTVNATSSTQCIQSITYPIVVRKYFDGVPKELRFNEKKPPGGWESYNVAKKVNFSYSLALNGNSWFVGGVTKVPYSWSFFSGFRGIPDSHAQAKQYSATNIDKSANAAYQYTDDISKTVINMTNDVPVTIAYLESADARRKANCDAKLRSLQNLFYVQVELGKTDWSVANDEGFDTAYNTEENVCASLKGFEEFEKHMPIMPYVRESNRLVGGYTVTAKDMTPVGDWPHTSVREFTSSVAIGDYGNDLHGCAKPEDLEGDLDRVEDKTDVRRIAQMPFESFITSDVHGLIAAEKNLSTSRLASAAFRTQPTTMHIGQAAGAIAAVALETRLAPHELDYRMVQAKILSSGGRIHMK